MLEFTCNVYGLPARRQAGTIAGHHCTVIITVYKQKKENTKELRKNKFLLFRLRCPQKQSRCNGKTDLRFIMMMIPVRGLASNITSHWEQQYVVRAESFSVSTTGNSWFSIVVQSASLQLNFLLEYLLFYNAWVCSTSSGLSALFPSWFELFHSCDFHVCVCKIFEKTDQVFGNFSCLR